MTITILVQINEFELEMSLRPFRVLSCVLSGEFCTCESVEIFEINVLNCSYFLSDREGHGH